MHTAKVTAKGQITLPAEIRKVMGLKSGSRVMFFQDADGDFVMRPRIGSIADLRGCFAGLTDVPKTDEETNELLHRHARELDEATKSKARKLSDGEAA
ncbi:MAG TPA: AbrB/MazE/SpoVT family DNA-binding domain-containing protein [Terracidiphilus sp.]|nr:AbrB/MazE/SpoVT family DNA-binding domain-containing protein [Terracidiphilus sp.]